MRNRALNKSLFANGKVRAVGCGFANISHVLRASDSRVLMAVKAYEQRCGHVPFDGVEKSYVLVSEHSDVIIEQLQYLSRVFHRTIEPKTYAQIKRELNARGETAVVAPYINVSETRDYFAGEKRLEVWGLPSSITDKLKNKAELHNRLFRSDIEGLRVPDFCVSTIEDLSRDAKKFFDERVVGLYTKYDSRDCPLGMVFRFAECDGNYGAGVVLMEKDKIVFYPDGNLRSGVVCDRPEVAFQECQRHIRSTINAEREQRVVVSRLVESADSPGMSFAIVDGEIISLGWNGQLQTNGTACVGTGTYIPKNEFLREVKEKHEEEIALAFGKLIRQIAAEEGVDFEKIRGVVNLDIIIPGKSEAQLQIKRFGKAVNYISESNPRFTNWTDALMTGIAAQGLRQNVASMKRIISEGIQAEDKYKLPSNIDPRALREEIYKRDLELKNSGIRLIARMTASPMGMIYMGNIRRARFELERIVDKLVEE